MPEETSPAALALRTGAGWVPLGFVRDGGTVFLIARERAAAWPIGVLRSGVAELRLPTGTVQGRARLVTDRTEREAILDQFRAAYGPERYARWYDRPSRVLRVDLAEGGTSATADASYSTWLEAEFDNIASEYDHHILGNRMNRLLRDRSIALLTEVFAGRRLLLDVGCGSGLETMAMLRRGHEIVAVDVSARMLDVVREKARAEGCSERVRTAKLRARDLAKLPAELGLEKVDGAYSTYGALNCEPTLDAALGGFAELLPAGGSLVVGIYNRWCLFELLGYGLTLQTARALGRRKNPVLVGSSRFCIDVYAYTVGDVDRAAARWFERSGLEGVPVILPPSDLTGYSERFAAHFERLATIDHHIGRWPGWNRLGDHFLATYRRSATGS
jgi:SAM-dependent methyltransferase